MAQMFFMSPEDAERFRAENDRQHMEAEAIEHSLMDMLLAMPKEQLELMARVLLRIGDPETGMQIATHYTGIIRMIMHTKHNACRCGYDHEQAEDLLKPSGELGTENGIEKVDPTEAADETVTDHAFTVGPGGSGVVCTAMVADEEGFGKDCGKAPELHLFTTSMNPRDEDSYTNSAAKIMAKYNVSPVDGRFPMVVCNNCSLTYPNLRDRMIKAPDDCHGCQQKAAFG